MATEEDNINKITYAFNKFFSGFVRDVKSLNDELRATIKANFKIIDKASDEYMESFWGSVGERFLDPAFDILAEEAASLEVIKGVTVKALLAAAHPDHEAHVSTLNTIYTLAIFAYLKKRVTPEEADTLFEQAVRILSVFSKGPDAVEEELEDVIDDDMKALFTRIKPTLYPVSDEDDAGDAAGSAGPSVEAMEDVMNKFGDGKIANLAKEIAQNIDVSDLKIESPADVMKMLDFSKGGSSSLGNIVQQVTGAISSKISSGELKQEDLVKEAMSMMGSLGGLGGLMGGGGAGAAANPLNNPFFQSMMKSMGGAGGKPQVRRDVIGKMAARDRLRKKFESRGDKKE
jgi:hypothetical protein